MIDVLIGGTADKPTLRLTSVPELSQADILSLILFGKTTNALGQGQQADLQQQAAKMAAGFAASQIGQAVASSMGLQSLGLELSGLGTSGGSVGIGHYLGENTYVSASQAIGSGPTSATSPNVTNVSVQYFITHWLSITTKTASDGSHEIDLNLIKQY
jgi:translocation and assembly module TamB